MNSLCNCDDRSPLAGPKAGRPRNDDDVIGMTATDGGERRVLVVENRAHESFGHFPVRCVELAEAFAAIGRRVDVLTSRGWAREGAAYSGPLAIHCYGPVARRLDHLAETLTTRKGERLGFYARRLGYALRVVAMIGAAKAWCRRADGSPPLIVVMSDATNPALAAAIAGTGSWLLYQFWPPEAEQSSVVRAVESVLVGTARRAERRRRGRGGAMRLALPGEAWAEAWAMRVPFLQPAVIPLAGCRRREPIPDARARLGLKSDERLALVFGTLHGEKDYDVVWRAFADLHGWRLLIVGEVADAYRQSQRQRCDGHEPILLGGYVDATTRDLVFCAADVVILSFQPNHWRDSGVLMDAIAWGVPVVCSGHSTAADIVRTFRLGVVFEPGNADSLAQAVRSAPTRITPHDLERARSARSDHAVVLRCLEALGEPERGDAAPVAEP